MERTCFPPRATRDGYIAKLHALHFRRSLRWVKRPLLTCLALVVLSTATLAVCWLLFPFPLERLDSWPSSPEVTDRDGGVLLDRVSDQGQWRFPVALSRMSPWLRQATVAIEDRRFYDHHGVDARAALRAAGQNIRSLHVVSGASTLTMQLCRHDGRPPADALGQDRRILPRAATGAAEVQGPDPGDVPQPRPVRTQPPRR